MIEDHCLSFEGGEAVRHLFNTKGLLEHCKNLNCGMQAKSKTSANLKLSPALGMRTFLRHVAINSFRFFIFTAKFSSDLLDN